VFLRVCSCFTTALALSLFTATPMAAQAPVVSAGGVVNAADYSDALAPGLIVSIYGQDLAPGVAVATAVPLPVELAGVNVEVVDGAAVKKAPLFFVSPGQINAQLPFDLTGGAVSVRVRRGDAVSSPEAISLQATAPRVFTTTMDGQGDAVVVHSDYTPVTVESPARAGEWVVLFLTGLGAANQPRRRPDRA
jgi:uncharacterized protein (TIGR03437 family)